MHPFGLPTPGPRRRFSRRDFMRLTSAAAASAAVAPRLSRLAPRVFAAPPLFEAIPPSASRIQWVHENAMSPDRYLPETMGPGVAFFDYDNDGWIDIFMVNSGAADFYTPKSPLKNALYKNNRDGTFTDVTDKAGVAGGKEFGMGCAVGDFDRTCWSPPTAGARSTGTTATARSPTSRRKPASPRRAGRPAPSGSTTTTTASWICSCAASSSSR
jgi:hypothetical protein